MNKGTEQDALTLHEFKAELRQLRGKWEGEYLSLMIELPNGDIERRVITGVETSSTDAGRNTIWIKTVKD